MLNVLIRRIIPHGKDGEVLDIIAELRGKAAYAKGYLSSEIMSNVENDREYVSMTKWINAASWIAWEESESFRELQKKLDILGCETKYELFRYPSLCE